LVQIKKASFAEGSSSWRIHRTVEHLNWLILLVCEPVDVSLRRLRAGIEMYLRPRERQIILRRFGIDCERQTLDQLAKKYGVSRGRIRKIQAEALETLRKFLSDDLRNRIPEPQSERRFVT